MKHVVQDSRGQAPPLGAVGPGGSDITHEDIDRARDRLAVARAREPNVAGHRRWLRLFWLFLGPGGAGFPRRERRPEHAFLLGHRGKVRHRILRALHTVHLPDGVRRPGDDGSVGRGHASRARRGHFQRFGRFWGWFAVSDLALGNFLTLVTEFIGVRAGLSFFGFPPVVSVGGAMIIVFFVGHHAPLLDLGAYRAWTGDLQRPFHPGRPPCASAVGSDRARLPHMDSDSAGWPPKSRTQSSFLWPTSEPP